MAKYAWDVEINGQIHNLTAEHDKRGSGFHLYDGEDYVANILPKKQLKFKIGIEQDFHIEGHRFTFVMLGYGVPDIVREGKMLGSGKDYSAEVRTYCISEIVHWAILIVAIVAWNIHGLVKFGTGDGILAVPIVSLPIFAGMVYELVKYIRRLRNDKIEKDESGADNNA